MFADKRTMRDHVKDIQSVEDAVALAKLIVESSENNDIASNRLTSMRNTMRMEGFPEDLIYETRIPEVTIAGEKERNVAQKLRDAKPIDIPEHWSLKKVSNRIAKMPFPGYASIYDTIDIMIAMCLRPSEVMNLNISKDGLVTGYSKGRGSEVPRQFLSFCITEPAHAQALLDWVRVAIKDRKILDPATSGGAKQFRRHLGTLKLGYLRKIGAGYVADVFSTGTIASSLGYMRLALRHGDSNKPSSAEFYTLLHKGDK